jgi:hypothetical protein
MWCGLPVVALNDNMGVAGQVEDGKTGVLIDTDREPTKADWRFGKTVVSLLNDPARRHELGQAAAVAVQRRADPSRWIDQYYRAFSEAREHCWKNPISGARRQLRLAESVVRWAGIHMELFGFGLLRPPAKLNRHGAKHPVWEAVAEEAQPTVRRRGSGSTDVERLKSELDSSSA